MNYKTNIPIVMRDEAFFQDLGSRVAKLRQIAGLSQAQLAEQLGLKQQALATYESATRRLPSSFLVPLCETLNVSLDELLGVEQSKSKRGPVPKLLRQFQEVSELPKSEQQLISKLLERFLEEPTSKAS